MKMVKDYTSSWSQGNFHYTLEGVSPREFREIHRRFAEEDLSIRYNPEAQIVGIFLDEREIPIMDNGDIPDDETRKRVRRFHADLSRALDGIRIRDGDWIENV